MFFESLQEELEQLEKQGLLRRSQRIERERGGRIRIGEKELVYLASNSYLGLHQHPRVIAAAVEATQRYGAGTGSARLLGGTLEPHEELEAAIAQFKQAEAALIFPTGYMANLGIVTALVGPGDLVIGDRLNHASLIDACRLSRATFRVYPHKDVERLEAALRRRAGRYRRILVVTEGLFSMDGDSAPLPEIVEISSRYGAILLIDDAHATGVLGQNGRGTLEHDGISPNIKGTGILQMGTFSKSLGSLGGFIAGPQVVIDYLKNKARSFIYTTALPAACVAASLEALRIVQEEPGSRHRLWDNVRYWVKGVKGVGCELISEESPIVPIVVGQTDQTMALAKRLFEEGVYAPGIRPPTVPAGSARIRTSITALHTKKDLDEALTAFKKVFGESALPQRGAVSWR